MIAAEREWHRAEGATVDELARLRSAAPELPDSLYKFLAYSNGGEGPLAVQPFNFCLDSADTIVDGMQFHRILFPGFLIFGSNGGGEYVAFDVRDAKPWPVVYIDMVAGPESAEIIAQNFEAFLSLVGISDA